MEASFGVGSLPAEGSGPQPWDAAQHWDAARHPALLLWASPLDGLRLSLSVLKKLQGVCVCARACVLVCACTDLLHQNTMRRDLALWGT